MEDKLLQASATSNSAQRNWDHDRVVPDDHLQLFLDIVKNCPCKQNETHYKLYYSTDSEFIFSVYRNTKTFTVVDDTCYTDNDGVTLDAYNVCNSQVNANLLFGFSDDWDQSKSRSMIHAIVDEREIHETWAYVERERQRYFSIGIAAGELILAANMLGYRTGLCSAFSPEDMQPYFGEDSNVRLIVGVGYPHPDKDRTEHEEVYNRDITLESLRTGPDDEKWKFPKFPKEMKMQRLPLV